MRSSSLLGLLSLVAGSFVVAGCASEPASDDAASQEGAATGAAKTIATGLYDSELAVIVKGAAVEGSYYAQIGDPAHGGATCSFTFAGVLEKIDGVDHAHITATDGYDWIGGELTAEAGGGVHARLFGPINACMRTSPVLSEPEGVSYQTREPIGSEGIGFRSVSAEKAFFYDRLGGSPRAAYVITGDTVEVMGPAQNGFLPVSYDGLTPTVGFIKVSDFAAQNAPVLRDTLRGAFQIEENDYLGAGFDVITSHNRDMFFNLTAVRKTGGMNMGDIRQGHAKIVGDTATWQGDGCTIKFAFAADAKTVQVEQDGECGDFGAGVHVGGKFLRQ